MDTGLKNKVALVTGASRGIGRGVALNLASEGCDVALVGRDAAALDEVAKAVRGYGRRAAVAALDLREPSAIATVADLVRKEFGGVDILVNNAGAAKGGDFLQLTDADFADGFALKFFAHVSLVRALWSSLKERRGSLVSIAGTAGRRPTAEGTIISSVNAAIAAFSKAMADRGKHEGVQVNTINPSIVETDRYKRRVKVEMDRTGATEPEARAAICSKLGITRIGRVEDIADFVTFLVSARGSYLHGATIDLDGGEIPVL